MDELGIIKSTKGEQGFKVRCKFQNTKSFYFYSLIRNPILRFYFMHTPKKEKKTHKETQNISFVMVKESRVLFSILLNGISGWKKEKTFCFMKSKEKKFIDLFFQWKSLKDSTVAYHI